MLTGLSNISFLRAGLFSKWFFASGFSAPGFFTPGFFAPTFLIPGFVFLACLLVLESGEGAFAADDIRIGRPAITLDLSNPLIDPEPNREPIAQAPQTPGIYRGFLVWRQKYAHLAICPVDLCHGSCIVYGDGCLVYAQSPILPTVMAGLSSTAAACAGGCAPSYVKQTSTNGAKSCATHECH
jgi:hypothetical protein